MNLLARRKLTNRVALTLSLSAMAFGLFWLAWILWTVLELGISGLSLTLFTEMTPPPGADVGGLANAIAGSLIMVVLATLLGTPIGILAGVYLAEYGRNHWLGSTTRFINDLLLSAPSIVIGLFVYAVVVAQTGKFSAWSGVLALALIVLPVVVRTTENMLQLIPNTLREAAFALGAPKSVVISKVTLRAARAGVLTGVLLAVARIAGETAPLLFTALSNQFWSLNLNEPMANLPVTIFKFAMSPFTNWQELAWAGVFLITMGVLVLDIIARVEPLLGDADALRAELAHIRESRAEAPDDAELRRRLDVLPGFTLKHLHGGPGGESYIALADEGGMPLSDSGFDAVLFFAEIAALEVPRLLDRLAHMREARDAARAEVERLAGQVEAVRAEVATDGAGWVEFIMPKTGTTHIAYVYEGGGTYLPDGELDSMNLLEATARGKAWRMVRATDVLAILTPRAES